VRMSYKVWAVPLGPSGCLTFNSQTLHTHSLTHLSPLTDEALLRLCPHPPSLAPAPLSLSLLLSGPVESSQCLGRFPARSDRGFAATSKTSHSTARVHLEVSTSRIHPASLCPPHRAILEPPCPHYCCDGVSLSRLCTAFKVPSLSPMRPSLPSRCPLPQPFSGWIDGISERYV
jgi:hypothetical protein